jgi:hypothetical protein
MKGRQLRLSPFFLLTRNVPEYPEESVNRHRVIREVSANDLSQSLSLKWNGFVHAPPQFFMT